MDALRLFIALSFSRNLRERCAALQERGRKQAAKNIKWVNLKQLHLTLVFLGKVLPTEQRLVEEIMYKSAERCSPFTLEFCGLGAFPGLKAPRVLWVGLKENPSLISLQKDLMDQILKFPFSIKSQPFRPHLTLGRIKGTPETAAFSGWVKAEENVSLGVSHISAFELIESRLTAEGPHYTRHLQVKLKKQV